jgi:hypothetical protein
MIILNIGFVHFFWSQTCRKLFMLPSPDDTMVIWRRNYRVMGSILVCHLNKEAEPF